MSTEHQLGVLQADVANLKKTMADDRSEAREDRKAILSRLDNIEKTLAKAGGYWKMGLIIAGFSTAIVSFVTWLLSWLPVMPKH